MRTLSKIRNDIDKAIEPYRPKIRYLAHTGAAIVCEMSASVAVQKTIRSKIPLNKLKYLGTAVAMHLASNACWDKAHSK